MLPPKVHARHGRYFYVHQNKWHPLTRINEGATALYTALQAFTSDRPAPLIIFSQFKISQHLKTVIKYSEN